MNIKKKSVNTNRWDYKILQITQLSPFSGAFFKSFTGMPFSHYRFRCLSIWY
jgi:hypothetical protein